MAESRRVRHRPTVVDELNAKLAAYLPPNSNKPSAFFKTTSRADMERIQNISRKDMVESTYEPRLTQTKKKTVCLV